MAAALPPEHDDPRWWLGTTVLERRTAARQCAPDASGRGETRLRLWREGRIVDGLHATLDAQRPESGRAELTGLAGETASALRERMPERPEWLGVVLHAWELHGPSVGHLDPDIALDERVMLWLEPLLAWARAELTEHLAGIDAAARSLPLSHPLLAPDRDRVLMMARRTLRLESAILERSDASRLAAADASPSGIDLLAGYPVLARELVRQLRGWVRVRAEFAERFTRDAPLLRERLGISEPSLAGIDELDFGAGDTHRRGRSVAVIGFDSGQRLVYKPRPLTVEARFNALLAHLDQAAGLPHPVVPLPVLDRGDYGWTGFVHAAPCADEAALKRFYRRQGFYCAVFYALRGYDMHAWNVIADGESPVYIDLEALFHAPFAHAPRDASGTSGTSGAADAPEDASDVTARTLRESVLTTHVLPRRVPRLHPGDPTARDNSGLAGGGIASARNRPRLRDRETDAPVDAAAVVAGFQAGYRSLLAERERLLGPGGPVEAFADAEVRLVLRNTRHYVGVLEQSFHPDLLRDDLDREHYFQVLTRGLPGLAARAAVMDSERRQLAEGDVPAFHTTPGSTGLAAFGEQVAPDFLRRSGLDAVRERFARLSEQDLAWQTWFVRASLGTLDPAQLSLPDRGRDAPSAGEGTADSALRAAELIADQLAAFALHDVRDGTVEWLGLRRAEAGHWAVGPVGLGLGDGVAGIALFLTESAQATGRADHRLLAEELVGGLVRAENRPTVEQMSGFCVGAYQDLGSMILLLVRLAELWRRPDLITRARELLPAVADNLARTTAVGVGDGLAGAVLALDRLHQAAPCEQTWELLRDAVDRLAARIEGTGADADDLGLSPEGFGQGLPGVAYVLANAACTSTDERLGELARSLAATFARSLTRTGDEAEPGIGWNRRLIGSGLAAAALAATPGCEPLRPALDARAAAAARTVLSLLRAPSPQPVDDSLSDGVAGAVELLWAVAGSTNATEAQDATDTLDATAQRLADALAGRVLDGTVRTGVPSGVWVPDLLLGMSGIGHTLLRAAHRGREAAPSPLAAPANTNNAATAATAVPPIPSCLGFGPPARAPLVGAR